MVGVYRFRLSSGGIQRDFFPVTKTPTRPDEEWEFNFATLSRPMKTTFMPKAWRVNTTVSLDYFGQYGGVAQLARAHGS